jgi:nucleoside-diphosphate-sugar epimerase
MANALTHDRSVGDKPVSESLPKPVIVIGANGFVGRQVVRALADTKVFRPIAARRRPPTAPAANGIETRICDAGNPAAVAAALADAAGAVNCVAGSGETMLAATRNICAAAPPGCRIIHLSSMAVYGAATGLIAESHAMASNGWYGQAKIQCEAIIQGHVAGGGDAVILRPGCIHGPGSDQWSGRIARLLHRHRIGDLGAAGDGLCNLIAVNDIAAAVIAALTQPDIAGEVFNLGDPDPGTWNQYFMTLARAIGATPVRRISQRWLKIESKILAIPLKLGEKAKLGRFVPDPLPGSLLALWRQEIQLDHRKTDARLGFTRTRPEQAIKEAAEWIRKDVLF